MILVIIFYTARFGYFRIVRMNCIGAEVRLCGFTRKDVFVGGGFSGAAYVVCACQNRTNSCLAVGTVRNQVFGEGIRNRCTGCRQDGC